MQRASFDFAAKKNGAQECFWTFDQGVPYDKKKVNIYLQVMDTNDAGNRPSRQGCLICHFPFALEVSLLNLVTEGHNLFWAEMDR